MYSDDEDQQSDEMTESGSDELLSDDNLRLPEHASMLVRLHAVRAWLTRRQTEMTIELGEAVLLLQQAMQESQESRPRRRNQQGTPRLQAQQAMSIAQQRLQAYEEAQALLADCIDHTTTGERALVEYYLTLDNTIQGIRQQIEQGESDEEARLAAFADVQQRVEHVGVMMDEE